MPKIEFASGFKKKSAFDFDKLTLEQGERARICVIEAPTAEYVHTFQSVIMEGGKPIMKTEKYGKDGSKTREVPETNYLGRYLCLGDFDTLESKGVDPDNCPACKTSIESSAVEGPKRRFGVHVIKYQVQKNSFKVQEPFQVELLVWDFTETRYTALADIAEEHGALPGIDLNLGPCENKGYQKYTITPGQKAEWMKDKARQATVAKIVETQKVPDVSLVLGRRATDAEMRSTLQDVLHAWNLAFGQPGGMPSAEEAAVDEAAIGHLDIFGGGPESVVTEENTDEAPAEPSEASPSPWDEQQPGAEDEDSEKSLQDLLGIKF